MPEYLIPIPIILVIAAIIFISFYYSKAAIVKRKLKKAVDKKISDFVSGDIAKIVGKVEIIGEPLIAPLSGRPCGYYYVLIEQMVSSGKSSHWETIIEEEVAGTFVVRDGRYAAHISNQKVKSYIVQDKIYKSGFGNDATAVLEKYLNDHGQKSEGLFGMNKTIRYKEGVLEEGELIAAIGRGEWKNAEHLKFEGNFDRVLEISATETEPIYLSDDPDTVKTKYSSIMV